MKMITCFANEYGWLSNFAPVSVYWNGLYFPSVEHGYVAAKSTNPEFWLKIQGTPTPGEAKRLGRKIELRPDWEHVKLPTMWELMIQKYNQHTFERQLIATDNAILIEGNAWGDRFWGCEYKHGEWVGLNWLGRLTMMIRDDKILRRF